MERSNGQTVMVKPYLDNINWTKGIDQKTGKPVDYDPSKDIQIYAGAATPVPGAQTKKMCPSPSGGNNFWPSTYSPKTKLIYIPALTACDEVTQDPTLTRQEGRLACAAAFRRRSSATRPTSSAIDPVTGELKAQGAASPTRTTAARSRPPAASCSPASPTARSSPIDDTTLEQLWKINVGVGFNAPPMTFEVERQAIRRDPRRPQPHRARASTRFTPELKEQRNQPMLFVFGL